MKFVKIDIDSNFIALQQFTKPGFANGMYMQDFTASMCNNAPTPQGTDYFLIGTLKDKRDNKQYEVRKFADGKCWMVDNLAYGGDTASGGVDGCLKTTFNGNTNATPTNIFGPGTYGDCAYGYNDLSTPDTNHYGYFYTYQAAVQNAQAYMGSDYQPTQPVQGLCPSGWHLPTTASDGDIETLLAMVGDSYYTFWGTDKAWKNALSGWKAPSNHQSVAGPISRRGQGESYFTAVSYTSRSSYQLSATALLIPSQPAYDYKAMPSTNNEKSSGYHIRCVKDTTEPILFGCTNPTSTMQAWHGCSALTTPTGANFTQGPCLMDERDGKTYQVRKFADGKCWMVTNLAYGGDTRNGGVDGCMKTNWGTQLDKATPTNVFGPDSYGQCRYTYDNIATPDTNQYGYFYTYQAAVQDPQAYYGNDYQVPQPTQGICPSGWRLPIGNTDGDFQALVTATGNPSVDFWTATTGWQGKLAGAGVINNIYQQGINFWYISSTQSDGTKYYNMKRNSPNEIIPNMLSDREGAGVTAGFGTSGTSIRCLQD